MVCSRELCVRVLIHMFEFSKRAHSQEKRSRRIIDQGMLVGVWISAVRDPDAPAATIAAVAPTRVDFRAR